MPIEQWLPSVLTIAGLLFGTGGIAAIYGVYVTRKLGIKTNQTEANRDLNTTWDSIVENLQSQINSQSAAFKEELTRVHEKVRQMEARQTELESSLSLKERIILKAIAHIYRLEAQILTLGGKPHDRPEGLE